MKYLCIALFFLSFYSAQGQDTIFYDYKWNKIKSSFGARYFEVTAKDSAGGSNRIVRKYKRPSMLLEETPYSDFDNKIIDGVYRKFYETGQLHLQIPYRSGKIHGELISYWGDGQLKRTDKFENGNFISGKILNTNKKELPYYPFIIEPTFNKKGMTAADYIAKKISYPEPARTSNQTGTVEVSCYVNEKGVLSNIQVLKGINPELDAEALRVIQEMPRWKPRYVDGIAEGSVVVIPVSFQLK
jgi:TonB family protein